MTFPVGWHLTPRPKICPGLLHVCQLDSVTRTHGVLYTELKIFPSVVRLLLFCNFYLLSQQLLLATPILFFSCCSI